MMQGARYSLLILVWLLLTTVLLLFIAAGKSTFTDDEKKSEAFLPLVLNTWPVPDATIEAWKIINGGNSAVDSVVGGCQKCEELQCRGKVGFGGSPDEIAETTLDAMIMDGSLIATYEVGSVGDLRGIKKAIAVAKAVMDYSEHTLIVGESAKNFAMEMGFQEESLTTNKSYNIWKDWVEKKCQPNFRKNVVPDPTKNCGPYSPMSRPNAKPRLFRPLQENNHDTIGMVVVDKKGNVASGTSTNGLTHKISGRVGDSPIAGAGSYASNLGGAAAATGNGDIMMRFLPSYHAVLAMENGATPKQAAREAIGRIAKFYPDFRGAMITADTNGQYAAACHGYENFTYCVRNPSMAEVKMFTQVCG